MATISVVLATYNEEKNIAECLESVKSLADEVIVVDGSSSDETVATAKRFGAKVIVTDNPAIFHVNKQKAIEKATKDWILQLDADERLTEELKAEIVSEINKSHNIVNGYWIPRKNFFLGRFLMKGGQYPDYTLRLYRKGKGKLPQKSVHEQAEVQGETTKLKNPLVHISDTSFSRYLLRFNRYTNLFAIELNEQRVKRDLFSGAKYLLIMPIHWFFLTYIRHKGFMDSWQGFIFSVFSAMRFPVVYIKYLRTQHK